MKLLSALLLTTLLAPTIAIAAPSSAATPADACTTEINDRLAQEQRIYRKILFGRRHAAEEPLGTTRYDTDAHPWIKMQANQWVSQATSLAGTVLTDSQLDQETEWEGMDDPRSDP